MADKILTHEEHVARAMLLGRVYDWRDGSYCILNRSIGQGMPVSEGMLDCLTCEPMASTRRYSREACSLMATYDWTDAPRDTSWGVTPQGNGEGNK